MPDRSEQPECTVAFSEPCRAGVKQGDHLTFVARQLQRALDNPVPDGFEVKPDLFDGVEFAQSELLAIAAAEIPRGLCPACKAL